MNTRCNPYGLSVRKRVAGLLLSAAMMGVWGVAPAAQPESEEDDLEELHEVQVTGTRIIAPNVTSANPITTVTGEEMRALGIVNVADALTTLVPQNVSTYMPTMIGDPTGSAGGSYDAIDRGSFFIGNTIANLRGLDPTYGSRTLTLIDGRRVPSTSNQADVVDLNIIPSNLLQRMDVVTGGASATYGSGAMAGVVNLVLNNRMTGVNVDVDYGVNEAGDGGNPHVSISGGRSFLDGRAHALFGVEWQDQSAILNCANARDWCAESRTMFTNYSGFGQDPTEVLAPLPGFEDFPARFQMANVRYSQFAPTGTIYHNDAEVTSGFRFTEDGTGIEEYSYGFRGGTGRSAMNGDGPLTTSSSNLRPSTERRSLFMNFEYNLTERTTAYMQASYARTDSENRNAYTRNNACVRFDTMGVAPILGGQAAAGDVIIYDFGGATVTDPFTGVQLVTDERSPIMNSPTFRAFIGATTFGYPNQPYWINANTTDESLVVPPSFDFAGNGVGTWRLVRLNTGALWWVLHYVTLTAAFDDPGTPAVLPELGRNAYAFLNALSPEALVQLQGAFNNSRTTGGGAATGLDALWGVNACNGFTAMRKVWNPQVQQWTTQEQEPVRALAGIRGRFGSDWRWEAYYQYGQTTSTSRQYNVATNLSFALAMDSVIDDREGSATFGQPVCRITRDGIPLLDWQGRPLSDPEGLAALAAGCQPLNIFGNNYANYDHFAGYDAAEMQRQALEYAFKENVSDGKNSMQTLSFTTSGTLWQGWAGPLTGAFGLELREDKVDNAGSRGPYYLRADFARNWGDAFGGRTRVYEGYTELNMPLISGLEGINLLSVNAALRYASYDNKGGAGTTGASASQRTTNWKFSTVFEPFDFVRLRLTRSRDLRAAGYRDLFLNQPSIPDQFSGINPWRERTASSTENQNERWGQVAVGNPLLEPEKSDTLTVGVVVSPGGWAQGMRLSADYYDIRVRDGITIPFTAATPIQACWEGSGNMEAGYLDSGEIDPNQPGQNGLFDDSLQACREITFGLNENGSRNLLDVVTYNSRRPANSLPFQRRGVDLSWNYTFPLNRAFEMLPGSVALTVRGQRALESSGVQLAAFPANVETYFDLVGQIRSSVFIPGVSATPKWTGNIISTYMLGDLTASLSARYIGGAKFDKEWTDDPESPLYRNEFGELLYASVDNNYVKPYFNFSLNGSYNLKVGNMKQFQVFGSINNLLDKSPPFTGGGLSGASAQYHDILGRAYRFGVRMRF